jgi:hypothetical protein
MARATRRTGAALAAQALGLVLLVLPGLVGASVVSGAGSAPAAPHAVTHSVSSAPHHAGLGGGRYASAAGPAASQVWYTQIGGTFSQFNGSTSQGGVKSLSVDVPLVSSVYPIGYELNGLTNRGDWYQIVVGDNWPGCPGLEMITEVWDNLQNGGPVGCDATVVMSAGDLIRLGLNFTSSTSICMDLSDVTRSRSHSICQAQPNSGASEFVTLPSSSDTHGYFTGPMTEIANISATSCPDYTHMPLVNYEWPSAFGISGFVPWSDEFEFVSGTLCYSEQSAQVTFPTGDPATSYQDEAFGSSFGPHFVAGQPFNYVNPSYGFRIQTDPVPITSVGLAATATTLSIGQNTTFTATVVGGVTPYTALWSLNGSLIGSGGLQRTWTAPAPRAYRFAAYGVDKNLDAACPSPTFNILANGPLSARRDMGRGRL